MEGTVGEARERILAIGSLGRLGAADGLWESWEVS